MLTKVHNAINAFPESAVSILGHTDSYGSDEKNLQLSTERAKAVQKYQQLVNVIGDLAGIMPHNGKADSGMHQQK